MTSIIDRGQSGFNASGAQYSEGGVYIKDTHGKHIEHGLLNLCITQM